ncbi:MAG: glycosyltransferase family 39 protein [Bacteroidia bacterium]
MKKISLSVAQRITLTTVLKFVLFATLAYFPFFLHLNTLPIRIWDESRLAVNASEMYKNGNFIVTYFENKPEMWNTKPPLLIWLQVGMFKLIGIGELALRLPSAIAGFLTTVVIMLFSVKYIKSYWFGLITCLVLITSYGYVNEHVTRTGDYDALLILFVTSYILLFFVYVETLQIKYLHWFFVGLTLAVLTKSVQGLLFLPALFVFVLTQKKLLQLNYKWIIINGAITVAVIAAYYLIREQHNTGFITAVWQNELGGRYTVAQEGNSASFMYYYNQLIDKNFTHWYWLVPCGIAIGTVSKDVKIKKITLYVTLLLVVYWLVISSSETKCNWYDAPMFPYLAILCAVAIYTVFMYIKQEINTQQLLSYNVLPYVFLFAVFLTPYQVIIGKVYVPKEGSKGAVKFYNMSYYLKNAVKQKENITNHYICYDGYGAHLQLYVHILNENNQHVAFKDWHTLTNGDKIITSQKQVQKYIESNYATQTVTNDTINNIKIYTINGFVGK